MSANTALINRSLTTIFNELEFLKDSDIISNEFFEQVTGHLPKKYAANTPMIGPIGGGAESQHQSTPAPVTAPVEEKRAPPPPPPSPGPESREIVEVMYDFQSNDPSDLMLRRGARVEVLEKVNNDWWRGRNLDTNAEGLFPSNYVSHSDAKGTSRPSPAPPGNQSYGPPAYTPGAPIAGGAAALYQQGPPQQPPQQYMPPFPQYAQPMQQPQPQPQQEQGSQGGHGTLGRLGSKFGNAAIFGAGATLGGDIINHIF